MARRGRKRKIGLRHPSGDLKIPVAPADRGPDETQARRAGYAPESLHALLTAKDEDGKRIAPPPFAAVTDETDNPLPALVRKGWITEAQAEAGEIFTRAHVRLWGPQVAPAARYQEYIPGDGPGQPRDQLRRFNTWQAAYSAIIAIGPEGQLAYSALRIVCLEWRPLPPSRLRHLRLALGALADHYFLRKAA